MAVQRNLWKPTFRFWPNLPCPSCKVGNISNKKNSIASSETAQSKRAHSHEAWDPEWIDARFSASMVCSNPNCGDTVYVCGNSTVEIFEFFDEDGGLNIDYQDVYTPSHFEPAPPVFPVPKECPEGVESELKKAFSLIWSDVGSSANRLRVAVEALMNERKIPIKTKIKKGPKKGKFQDLTLHQRIKIFEKKHKEAAAQLMAIKWLGNVGSHAFIEGLTHDDLLDAFEHFEFALDLVYVDKSAALIKRAKQINKKKGPVGKKAKKIKWPGR